MAYFSFTANACHILPLLLLPLVINGFAHVFAEKKF